MADKKFSITFDVNANLSSLNSALSQMKANFSKLNLSDSINKDLNKTFTQLEQEITKFTSLTSKKTFNIQELNEANRSFQKISNLFNVLQTQTSKIHGIKPENLVPQKTLDNVKELDRLLKNLESISLGKVSEEVSKLTKDLNKAKTERSVAKATYEGKQAEQIAAETIRDTASQQLEDQRKKVAALKEEYDKLNRARKSKDESKITETGGKLEKEKTALDKLQKSYDAANKAAEKAALATAKAKTAFEEQKATVKGLNDQIKKLESGQGSIEEIRKELQNLEGLDLNDIPTDLEKLREKIEQLRQEKLQIPSEGLKKIDNNAEEAAAAVQELNEETEKQIETGKGYNEQARDLENLGNQVKQFFSIGNTVQLFKRAIRSAFDTIKELDAVMTQTAVVTDFSVGDMWNQLPEYTKRANELGVSVKGAYEAATLYYQQGLDTNQVIGVSNETLKMAKIAAIDYATATDYMTSALRGFNMEVNEDSARRVNDIYSELAARTAADTEEISIAMSKTAPLAHNAGMEIETTAAFLSQAIETTREAPETIGTALKTVIARFQELKKDPALIEPVEGEIVDANKIEGALRTIGVALRDTKGQFRDLDDVFLEISQKWDSLDTNTQRYIATVAAGSRQQSRFIAMMANYDRIMELVEMANNSAGASQQQFEKTLDSMQSKLDRLKNAWNEFTMGLANNSVIKAVIDALTGLLNVINKISSGLSGNNGFLKSLFDIGILAGSLKAGKSIFNGFFSWLQGKSKVEGQNIGTSLFKGIFNQKAIFGGTKTFLGTITQQLVSLGQGTSSLGQLLKYWGGVKGGTKTGIGTLLLQLKSLKEGGTSITQIFKYWTNGLNPLTERFRNLGIIGSNAGKAIVRVFNLLPTPLKIAIPLIAALGIAINKIAKENSIEEKIKKAEESTKRAETAANQAKEAYDNLLEGKSKYSELQNTLDNLTYGTTAWKEALIEANNQILQLVNTFPQLAGYLTTGTGGRLQILDSGWDEVIKQQEEAIRRTSNDLIGSQIYKSNLENEKLFKNLQKELGLNNRPEFLNELIDLYKTNPIAFTKDGEGNYRQELLDFLDIEGVNADYIRKADPDKIIASADAIGQYVIAIGESENSINSYIKNLIATNSDLDKLEPETAQAIQDAFSKGIAKNYNQKVDKETENLQQYWNVKEVVESYGLEAENSVTKNLKKLYTHLAQIKGKEIDETILSNNKAMAEAIARMRFGDEIQSNINDIIDLVKNDTSGGVQKILDVFGEELSKFDNRELDELASAFGEGKDLKSAAKALNMNKEVLEEAIIDMGYTMTDASGNLVADFESFRQAFFDGVINLQQGIIEARKNITNNLVKAGFSEEEASAKTSLYNDKQAIAFSGFTDKVSSLETWKLSDILQKASDVVLTGGDEGIELLNSIDLSKPIETIIALQDAAKSTSPTIRALAEEMLSLDSTLGTDKAFQDFMMSDEYSEMEESLNEFIKTNGKISSKNIKDLAQENTKLNKLLQLETINANGLAIALTAVGNGTIGFDQITSSMLEAFSSTVNLNDELEELNDKFSNFDKGFDTNINVENYQKAFEELQTYIDNGELGNEQFKNLYDFLFGEGAWAEAVENDFAGLQDAVNAKKQMFDRDGLAFWEDVIQKMNGGEISIEGLEFDAEGNLLDSFSLTTEELKEQLIQTMKITPDEATAMLGALKTYNPAAALKLEQNDAEKEYITWLQGLEADHASFTQKTTTVTAQQIELWSQLTGKSVAQITEELNNLNGSVKVVNWFNDEGVELYGQELYNKMHQTLSTEEKEWNFEEDIGVKTTTDLSTGKVVKYVDYEVAIKYAADNGLTMEQLDSLLKDAGVQVHEATVGFKADTAEMTKTLDELANTKSGELGEKVQTEVDGVDTSTFEGNVQSAIAAGASSGLQQAMDGFSPSTVTVPIDFDITGNSGGTITYSITAAEGTTLDNPKVGKITGANNGGKIRRPGQGRIFTNKASGTKFGGLKHNEVALTGEEGYELAYDSHGAFLLGENGPEVAKLEKGTVIYPHELSKKILRGHSKSIFPNHKTGTIPNYADNTLNWTVSPITGETTFNTSTVASDSASIASSWEDTASAAKDTTDAVEDVAEETEEVKNDIDFLYNKTQEINNLLRQREKLERQYQRLLKTHTATGDQLKQITDEEIAKLQKRQEEERKMIELRKKELHTYMMLNKEMMKYAIIDNWDDMTIHIAWDTINSITDQDEYNKMKDFLSELEKVVGEVQDLEDDVEDIEDDLIELKNRGKEQYRDLEDRVLDALIKREEEKIDAQEETNKAITDAKNDLINSIKTNIDKMRQDRKNEETETSLAEKERRLAYLRQDTTGSNALEIKKLEKELRDDRQDYTDSLIDQAIDNMKEEADEAAKQRDEQIEMLRKQLEWQEKTGYWADEATRIVQEGLEAADVRGTELYDLLYEGEGVSGFSNASKEYWTEELQNTAAEAKVWYENGIKAVTEAILNKEYKADYMAEMMEQLKNNDLEGFAANEEERNEKIDVQGSDYAKTTITPKYEAGKAAYKNGELTNTDNIMKDVNSAISAGNWPDAFFYAGARDAKINSNETLQLVFEKWYTMTDKGKKFATGGLADFTGPAWLDGSKSKPEMVLNPEDTKNFIELKNLLAGMNLGSGTSDLMGDWYFNIAINVDKIDSDYDVDKVAARVKQSIYNEATYRNTNAINFLK